MQKQHQQKRLHLLTRREGITLIEVIISLAIFGILMVLFTTLMGVATQMRKNVFEQNRNSMKLVKELTEGDLTQGIEKQMTFQFNGISLTIPGHLKTKKEGDVTYYVFQPREYEVKEDE